LKGFKGVLGAVPPVLAASPLEDLSPESLLPPAERADKTAVTQSIVSMLFFIKTSYSIYIEIILFISILYVKYIHRFNMNLFNI
jgi:hypothetical protein